MRIRGASDIYIYGVNKRLIFRSICPECLSINYQVVPTYKKTIDKVVNPGIDPVLDTPKK